MQEHVNLCPIIKFRDNYYKHDLKITMNTHEYDECTLVVLT